MKGYIYEVQRFNNRVKVIVDGEELRGLTAINFTASVDKIPELNLTAAVTCTKNDCSGG